jgi:hypothetical protein
VLKRKKKPALKNNGEISGSDTGKQAKTLLGHHRHSLGFV